MKLLNKFFKKGELEEEHFEIDENGNRIDNLEYQSSKEQNLDIIAMINNLNLEQTHQAKELIEKRLKELHSQYGLDDNTQEISVSNNKNNSTRQIGEQKVEQKVDEDFLNDETVEIDGDMILEDEYFEVKEPQVQEAKVESKPQPEVQKQEIKQKVQPKIIEEVKQEPKHEEIKEKIAKKVDEEEVLDKLKAYFGAENIFQETRNDLKNEVLKNKEVYCIGIRSKEAFSDENFDMLKQNSWFIRNIKKLDELKNFKMISSSNVEKNLVWDKGEYAILISYKAINMLKSPVEFNFN